MSVLALPPGIPPVSSDDFSFETLSPDQLMTADDPDFFGQSSAPQWGLFDQNGNPVLQPDSVVDFEYRQDYEVSDYPQEQGAFTTYNKVQTPFDVRIRMSKGGSDDDRREFLESVDAIIGSLDLYDVVTPEQTYSSVNLKHRDFRRTNENGAGLILIDLWGVEIRQTATAAFSTQSATPGGTPGNTKSPSGAGSVTDGEVQTITVTGTPMNKVQNHISGNPDGSGW